GAPTTARMRGVRWQEADPGLPIKFGPCSNGEYAPVPLSCVAQETIRRARDDCDEAARRVGMSRRKFLLSICGAATTLLALEACSDEEAKRAGRPRGGRLNIPPEAKTDPAAARNAIGGE